VGGGGGGAGPARAGGQNGRAARRVRSRRGRPESRPGPTRAATRMIEPRRRDQPPATTLVDILDRVLDKGLVVAGDIRVSLANVELLTVRIRLLVCSIDKAAEIGLDWWRRDSFLSSQAEDSSETVAALEARIAVLERQLALPSPPTAPRRRSAPQRQPRPGRESWQSNA